MTKILLIEDDLILQKMYQNKFQKMDYQVLVASDGGEGYKVAKNEKPDLILLDLMMPKVSGIAALKMLKEDQDTINIPVAILSVIPQDDPILDSSVELLKDIISFWRKDETNPSDIVYRVNEYLKNKQSSV